MMSKKSRRKDIHIGTIINIFTITIICALPVGCCTSRSPTPPTTQTTRGIGGTEKRLMKPSGHLQILQRTDTEKPKITHDQKILTQNDRFAVVVHMETSAHVYIFHIAPSGDVTCLFPNATYGNAENPLKSAIGYRIPEKSQWLVLDQNKGLERFLLLAYPTALQEPEKVLQCLIHSTKRGISDTRPSPLPSVNMDLLLVQTMEIAHE